MAWQGVMLWQSGVDEQVGVDELGRFTFAPRKGPGTYQVTHAQRMKREISKQRCDRQGAGRQTLSLHALLVQKVLS